jgi:AcrR family transcriptional regulator
MQYLKDGIRENILAAALKEFKENGFLEANMRNIAWQAGITVGNIYRYFKSKDALFEEIMEPVKECMMSLLLVDVDSSGRLDLDAIMESVLQVCRRYSLELLVLINRSKGSKYENIKEEFIRLIEKRLEEEMPAFRGINSACDAPLAYIMAATFVEGVFIILKKYEPDIEKIDFLIRQLIAIFFQDIQERLVSGNRAS